MSDLQSAAVFKVGLPLSTSPHCYTIQYTHIVDCLSVQEMSSRLDADKVKKIGKTFLFNINPDSKGDSKSWLVDLTSGNGAIKEASASDKADCTITIKDSDFVKLVQVSALQSSNPHTYALLT